MAIKRAFISFAFDLDEDLRNLLAGQAKLPDSPFELTDANRPAATSVKARYSHTHHPISRETALLFYPIMA